jgi:hypothetical protein
MLHLFKAPTMNPTYQPQKAKKFPAIFCKYLHEAVEDKEKYTFIAITNHNCQFVIPSYRIQICHRYKN